MLITTLAYVEDQIGLQDIGVFGLIMGSRIRVLSVFVIFYVMPYGIYVILFSQKQNAKLDKEALFED